MFCGRHQKNKFICIDGQQRLNTIFNFINPEKGFSFSEKGSGSFSGKKFSDLDGDELAQIEKYEFDVEIVTNASMNDVADFFIRLQEGVPLNPAEKLNAILGDVRDFVCDVSQHAFFTDIIGLRDYRFSNNYLAAQIVLLAKSGLHNLKSRDLKDMYEGKPLDEDIQTALKGSLEYLLQTFPKKSSDLRNRATIISMFYFVHEEFENLSLANKRALLKGFLKAFQKELRRQSKLEESKRDSELQTYRTNVLQAADTLTAIRDRHRVLVRRFTKFERDGTV